MFLLQIKLLVVVVKHGVHHFHLFWLFVDEVIGMVNFPESSMSRGDSRLQCLPKPISNPDSRVTRTSIRSAEPAAGVQRPVLDDCMNGLEVGSQAD